MTVLLVFSDSNVVRELLAEMEEGQLVRRGAMASHEVITQDGKTRFACHVCPKMFTNYSNLVRHRRKCEGTGFYLQCSQCGMPFYRRDNYQDHLVKKHGMQDRDPRYSGRKRLLD
jgi:uncharacterized C2H2 Zn-finger protein